MRLEAPRVRSSLSRCDVRARAWLVVPIVMLFTRLAAACPSCPVGRQARSEVFGSDFGPNLLAALLPFVAVGAVLRLPSTTRHVQRSLVVAGILLGTGLGGFVDGIVLHQILQWHNMLSSVRPPTDLVAMKYNMVWDGLFHAFMWSMVCLGIWRLWVAVRERDAVLSTRTLLGAILLGWGLFNFVEGVLDHEILGLHHVHPGAGELAWDLGFLALGLAQIVGGWRLARRREA